VYCSTGTSTVRMYGTVMSSEREYESYRFYVLPTIAEHRQVHTTYVV